MVNDHLMPAKTSGNKIGKAPDVKLPGLSSKSHRKKSTSLQGNPVIEFPSAATPTGP